MTTFNISPRTCAAGFVLAASTLAAQAAPLLQFDTALKAVNVGDSFVLLLQGSGFDMTAGGLLIDNLSGGQKLNLAFTPGTLELLSIDIDSRWTFAAANKTGVTDNAAGTLTGLAFGTFPATGDDSFNIARISFKALVAGPAEVVATAVDFAGKVNGVAGTKFGASYLGTAVQVTSAVPEPQSWALLAAGLGLLAWRARRA